MSTTTLNLIYKTKAVQYAEYPNGHGSAPPIWEYMCTQHLKEEYSFFDDPQMGRICKLALNNTVPLNRRLTCVATFDYAVMPVGKLIEFATAFEETHRAILCASEWTWSHWAAIAKDVAAIAAKHDHRLVGVGIGCTSVSDPWEWWEPTEGTKGWDAYEYVTAKQQSDAA